jgi:hypothetical protein
MRIIGKTAATGLAAFAALALAATSSFADSLAGTWKVTDTSGKAFEIVLAADGSAKADRSGEGMTGTWEAEGDAAVITWDTGWITRIAKDGAGYKKTAYAKDADLSGEPSNSSPAEKVK